MDVGKRIRELRERRGIEQLELANKVNISQSKMNKIETGFQKRMETDVLVAISDVLGVTVDYLVGKTDTPSTTTYNKVIVAGQEINLTSEELVLFEELKKHPIMLHDLASDPERKVKELIKLYKMKKMFLDDDDDEDLGDGFGTLKD